SNTHVVLVSHRPGRCDSDHRFYSYVSSQTDLVAIFAGTCSSYGCERCAAESVFPDGFQSHRANGTEISRCAARGGADHRTQCDWASTNSHAKRVSVYIVVGQRSVGGPGVHAQPCLSSLFDWSRSPQPCPGASHHWRGDDAIFAEF